MTWMHCPRDGKLKTEDIWTSDDAGGMYRGFDGNSSPSQGNLKVQVCNEARGFLLFGDGYQAHLMGINHR